MISKNQIKYIRQLEQKKFRRREGLFVAEGTKVVGDLLQRYQPKAIFATAEWINHGDWSHDAARQNHGPVPMIQEVTPDELQRISFQQHPQQVLALFPLPVNSQLSTLNSQLSTLHSPLSTLNSQLNNTLSLALDGVQDPGNLGTIIRIADWFGIETIICSEDTVDAWNPKVVQATMGSLSRVNIIYIDLLELLDTLPSDFPVYGTLLDGENIYTQELSSEGLIIMGNEGNGISEAVRSRVNRRLLIPSFRPSDTADSLNVAIATAITCSEFRRR